MAKAMTRTETAQDASVDPVTLEVVRAGLHSIIGEMSITLNRTSYSTILREINDYSCVLFDSRGRLLAQAEGIPIFNGSMNFVIDAGDREISTGRDEGRRHFPLQRSLHRRRHAQERHQRRHADLLAGRAGYAGGEQGASPRHRRQGPRQLVGGRPQHLSGGSLPSRTPARAGRQDERRGSSRS